MAELLNVNRRKILFACCIASLLLGVALALNPTNGQQRQVLNQKDKGDTLEQIEKSLDQPLRVVEDNDAPLRIVDARVKEISGSHFTKLTGKTTSLVAVSSVPEGKVINSSGKTVTGFMFVIRDPQSRSTRGIVQNNVSIFPGETYTITRQHFIRPEKVTVFDKDGQIRDRLIQPEIDSEKYWVEFAGRSDLFVAVVRVSFEDGSIWTIKEGGEIK